MDTKIPPSSPRALELRPVAILPREIAIAGPKCPTRVPEGLVQIRGALATQEARPDSSRAPPELAYSTSPVHSAWFGVVRGRNAHNCTLM